MARCKKSQVNIKRVKSLTRDRVKAFNGKTVRGNSSLRFKFEKEKESGEREREGKEGEGGRRRNERRNEVKGSEYILKCMK